MISVVFRWERALKIHISVSFQGIKVMETANEQATFLYISSLYTLWHLWLEHQVCDGSRLVHATVAGLENPYFSFLYR